MFSSTRDAPCTNLTLDMFYVAAGGDLQNRFNEFVHCRLTAKGFTLLL